MVSRVENDHFCNDKQVSRTSRSSLDPDDSFSLRSPLNRKPKEWEQNSPRKERHRNSQGGKQRHERLPPAERKPTLAQFAPGLMTQLGVGVDVHTDSASSRSTFKPTNPKSSPASLQSPLKNAGMKVEPTRRINTRRRSRTSADATSTTKASPKTVCTDESLEDFNDRRVRKCLWADEVDEAFVDGDNVDGEPMDDSQPQDCEAKPLSEQQLARRQKDLDYGKSTAGYTNYLQQVPKEERKGPWPQTPEKTAPFSRRKWDSLVHKWRKHLHNWDSPSQRGNGSLLDSYETDEDGTPSKAATLAADEHTPSPCKRPVSSVSSTPSDQGYATTPDSVANISWQRLDEEEDDSNDDTLLPEHCMAHHFPVLTPTTADKVVPHREVKAVLGTSLDQSPAKEVRSVWGTPVRQGVPTEEKAKAQTMSEVFTEKLVIAGSGENGDEGPAVDDS